MTQSHGGMEGSPAEVVACQSLGLSNVLRQGQAALGKSVSLPVTWEGEIVPWSPAAWWWAETATPERHVSVT